MTDREYSLGELADDLRELKAGVRHLDERFNALDQGYLRRDLAVEIGARRDAEMAAVRAELAEIKARALWAWRAGVTGVLFPVIVGLVVLLLTKGAGA